MLQIKELNLCLKDTSYKYTKITHDREIVRAIVIDSSNNFYFVNPKRDDDFGKLDFIETSGGGVENSEDFESALMRELKEELGFEVEIICSLGIVSDYYNLICRHNINHYYLCRITKKVDKHLTYDEINSFHLKTHICTYEDALAFYEKNKDTKLGRLIYNREVPILKYAKKVIEENNL